MIVNYTNLGDTTFLPPQPGGGGANGGATPLAPATANAPNNGVPIWFNNTNPNPGGTQSQGAGVVPQYGARWPGALSANYKDNTVTNGILSGAAAPTYVYTNVGTYANATVATTSPTGWNTTAPGTAANAWNTAGSTANGRLVVDTNPRSVTNGQWKSARRGLAVGDITDGLSKTIAITEDVGRAEAYGTYRYDDPFGAAAYNGGKRAAWRWAEPDNSNGVSGPPNGMFQNSRQGKIINNNSQPFGGPAANYYSTGSVACLWTTTNCGPNDEPFSFHINGCNCLFMDGSVRFIRDDIDQTTFKRLITPIEGIPSGYVEN